MSQLRRLSVNQILNVTRVLNATQQRAASHWFPDYKPGPYPKTEQERRAAAKKYNLLPEEYEPYPDDGSGSGDYPKLPFESVDAKDPYYPYDHPELRRDFMEPVHRKIIILFPEFLTTQDPPYGNVKAILKSLAAAFSFLALLLYLRHGLVANYPVLERQIPHKGETHYIFAVDQDSVDLDSDSDPCKKREL